MLVENTLERLFEFSRRHNFKDQNTSFLSVLFYMFSSESHRFVGVDPAVLVVAVARQSDQFMSEATNDVVLRA